MNQCQTFQLFQFLLWGGGDSHFWPLSFTFPVLLLFLLKFSLFTLNFETDFEIIFYNCSDKNQLIPAIKPLNIIFTRKNVNKIGFDIHFVVLYKRCCVTSLLSCWVHLLSLSRLHKKWSHDNDSSCYSAKIPLVVEKIQIPCFNCYCFNYLSCKRRKIPSPYFCMFFPIFS